MSEMTQEDVREWVLLAPFSTLTRKINSFSEEGQKEALEWARKLREEHRGDEAQIKWAVAVIGTLAPEELEHN